jgi:ATP phosphoribosyltransferase regulatory subunit HisZ
MLAPRREVQQRLGRAVPAFGGAFDQKLADHLRAGRAAGLARRGDAMAAPLEPAPEPRDLGRLARSFAAFEGDETPRGVRRHESQPNR